MILITLLWLTYFELKKSKVVFGILIALDSLCAFIGFVASCMYSVGLKYTRDNSNGYFDVILRATGVDSKSVENGRVSTWIACLGWMIYAVMEFVAYRYYEKNLLE